MRAGSSAPGRVGGGRPASRGAHVTLGALAALAAVAVGMAPADARPLGARIAIVVLGVVAAALLARRLATATRSTPDRFEASLEQEDSPPAVIPSLRAIDQTLRTSMASGFGVVKLLRPLLTELAAWRLLRDRRIDLEATPELAGQALGASLWRLIEERDVSAAWTRRGVRLAEIRAAVDDLEAL